jgi:dephospho-CoA kinase
VSIKRKKLIVGLTGGIASGKTTYRLLFESLGAQTACCDEIARRALRKNTRTYRAITEAFGPAILNTHKQIDRARLGHLIFRSVKKRKCLEEIIHPFVYNRLELLMRRASGILILDVPLLFETGFDREMDATVLVWCPLPEQRRRLMKRNALTRAEASRRIQTQMPLAKKKARADYVIDNSILKKGVSQAVRVWEQLEKKL